MDAQELTLRNLGRFAPAACTETHAGVKAMLWSIVNKHADRYGGDREEMYAEANYGFMRAYISYDPTKSAWTTWCWWWVWGRLMDRMKKAACRSVVDSCTSLDNDDQNLHDSVSAAPAEIDIDVVTARLTSADAKAVLRMVLDVPAELASTMKGTSDSRGVRAALRGYLAGLGWTVRRIVDSLNEIRGVV